MNRDTQIVKVICLTMQVVLFAIVIVLALTAALSSDSSAREVIMMTVIVAIEGALAWIEIRMDIIEAEREGNIGRSN